MFYVCGDLAPCLHHYANVTGNGSLHELPRLLHIPGQVVAGLIMGRHGIRLAGLNIDGCNYSGLCFSCNAHETVGISNRFHRLSAVRTTVITLPLGLCKEIVKGFTGVPYEQPLWFVITGR